MMTSRASLATLAAVLGFLGVAFGAFAAHGMADPAAKALMPASYRDNRVIFPPAAALAACEYGAYEGPERARIFEEAFTRIRAA